MSVFSHLDARDRAALGKDPQGGGPRIGPNGVQKLLNDLGLDPLDRKVLLLCWKLNAENQCEFTQKEFTEGLKAMRFTV
jgi:hypothetical protein